MEKDIYCQFLSVSRRESTVVKMAPRNFRNGVVLIATKWSILPCTATNPEKGGITDFFHERQQSRSINGDAHIPEFLNDVELQNNDKVNHAEN